MIFADDPADDRVGPYRELAPGLLDLPDTQIQWLSEDPTGEILLEIPADFVRALLELRVEDAIRLFDQAVRADTERTKCLDPRPHGPHEWFNARPTLRRECQGR